MSLFILAQGTLHKDPQSRTSASGKPFCTAQLRTEQDGVTTWCSLIAFDQTAQDELLRCHAGDAVAVQGRLKVTTYERGGEVRPSLDITASSVLPLKPKPRARQPRQARTDGRQYDARQAFQRPDAAIDPDFDDPVPFG
ncbi:single-stranded DNA-binding protein [Methylococcus capsulatus]|uniref:single-stranded DNA-binding protein n=1 Tax=Methylococcus capsulatus TaxID=414 RepID=UPI001C532D42|nr:single-stranded DNA-binding protein [Methylococcus capsulatus]QXP90017.1 single-stranded DNA-binding protein [Methylococcus capsulatus]